MQHTALYEQHLAAGAKMVGFAGWLMPIHYGSQLQEHQQVRQAVGVFDVSHMQVLDVGGKQAREFLRQVLANDVAKLRQAGKALYSCMLNPQGGVIDDLIVYYRGDDRYRLVLNASRAEVDLAWLKQQAANFDVNLSPQPQLAMLAVQGPQTYKSLQGVLADERLTQLQSLKNFQFLEQGDYFIARTGYTGEYGYEMIVPAKVAQDLWQAMLAAGIKPIGLGARDTLRLEAGLNLYGNDMDETTSPLVSNLSWTISFDEQRDFIGQEALLAEKQQPLSHKLIGLVIDGRGVLRHGQAVLRDGQAVGVITSGSFSPTMNAAIAMARVDANLQDYGELELRKQTVKARLVNLPFVRNGEVLV